MRIKHYAYKGIYSHMSMLNTAKKQFLYYKSLSEEAIKQISPEDLFKVPTEGSNSVAIIMKHIAGNMLSRWTNIFTEDGEKEWRHRDEEFEDRFNDDVDELWAYWEKGWNQLLTTVDSLKEEDLQRIIYIRNQGCTVSDALIRQLSHYPYHVGQIVFLVKLMIGSKFRSLSIPKGNSGQYNKKRFLREKTLRHFTEDTSPGSKED